MGDPNDFLSRAAAPRRGLLRELMAFLRQEKKWWLVPLLITLLLLGVVVVLSGSSAAPFLYTLF